MPSPRTGPPNKGMKLTKPLAAPTPGVVDGHYVVRGCVTMLDDLRERLDQMATEELVDALRRRDLDEWRPEVFPLVETILHNRGVDVAAVKAESQDAGVVESEPPEFVRALDLPDPAMLLVAKSVLDEAGVQYYIRGENAQHFLGVPMAGPGFMAEPPTLMVEASSLREVQDILEPLLTDGVGDRPDED